MDSWNALLDYTLRPPTIPPPISLSNVETTPYFACTLPSTINAPAYFVSDNIYHADERILARCLRAVRNGINSLPEAPEFPATLLRLLVGEIESRLEYPVVDRSFSTHAYAAIESAARPLVRLLFEASGHADIKIARVLPTSVYSRAGDHNWNLHVKAEPISTVLCLDMMSSPSLIHCSGPAGLEGASILNPNLKVTKHEAIANKVILLMLNETFV